MLLTILNVVYVLIAIAMVVLILLQRGAGAQAGSGFGAGASATVFGSRGAGNFLSKSTKYLAIVFFGISLFMAWYATHSATQGAPAAQDLGVMADVPVAPAPQAPSSGGATVPVAPQAPAGTVPAAPAPAQAPAAAQPQPAAPQGATQPAPQPQTPPQGG